MFVCMRDDSARVHVFVCVCTGPDAPLSPPVTTDKSVSAGGGHVQPGDGLAKPVSSLRCTFHCGQKPSARASPVRERYVSGSCKNVNGQAVHAHVSVSVCGASRC